MTNISRLALGFAISAARESAGLTVADMVRDVGMSHGTYSRTENGLRDVSVQELRAIAARVGLTYTDLMTMAERFEEKAQLVESELAKVKHQIQDIQRAALELAATLRENSNEAAVEAPSVEVSKNHL